MTSCLHSHPLFFLHSTPISSLFLSFHGNSLPSSAPRTSHNQFSVLRAAFSQLNTLSSGNTFFSRLLGFYSCWNASSCTLFIAHLFSSLLAGGLLSVGELQDSVLRQCSTSFLPVSAIRSSHAYASDSESLSISLTLHLSSRITRGVVQLEILTGISNLPQPKANSFTPVNLPQSASCFTS